MKNQLKAVGKGERQAQVYIVSLDVEVWPAGEERPREPLVYRATKISLQGFYLRCDDPIDLPHRFNFAVLFPKRSTNEKLQLINGRARIVRREQHFAEDAETFGVEAKIEEIHSMWEGEEQKAS